MRFPIPPIPRLGSTVLAIVFAATPCGGHGNFHEKIQRSHAQIAAEPEPDLYLETANALIVTNSPEDEVKQLDAGMTKLGIIPSLAE